MLWIISIRTRLNATDEIVLVDKYSREVDAVLAYQELAGKHIDHDYIEIILAKVVMFKA